MNARLWQWLEQVGDSILQAAVPTLDERPVRPGVSARLIKSLSTYRWWFGSEFFPDNRPIQHELCSPAGLDSCLEILAGDEIEEGGSLDLDGRGLVGGIVDLHGQFLLLGLD